MVATGALEEWRAMLGIALHEKVIRPVGVSLD
jgi:hypothetical protein